MQYLRLAFQQKLVGNSCVAKSNYVIVFQYDSRVMNTAVIHVDAEDTVDVMKCKAWTSCIVFNNSMNAVCTISLQAQTDIQYF